ncbi:hypothetical protein DF186_14825, partial [Enterococcus hirae]
MRSLERLGGDADLGDDAVLGLALAEAVDHRVVEVQPLGRDGPVLGRVAEHVAGPGLLDDLVVVQE